MEDRYNNQGITQHRSSGRRYNRTRQTWQRQNRRLIPTYEESISKLNEFIRKQKYSSPFGLMNRQNCDFACTTSHSSSTLQPYQKKKKPVLKSHGAWANGFSSLLNQITSDDIREFARKQILNVETQLDDLLKYSFRGTIARFTDTFDTSWLDHYFEPDNFYNLWFRLYTWKGSLSIPQDYQNENIATKMFLDHCMQKCCNVEEERNNLPHYKITEPFFQYFASVDFMNQLFNYFDSNQTHILEFQSFHDNFPFSEFIKKHIDLYNQRRINMNPDPYTNVLDESMIVDKSFQDIIRRTPYDSSYWNLDNQKLLRIARAVNNEIDTVDIESSNFSNDNQPYVVRWVCIQAHSKIFKITSIPDDFVRVVNDFYTNKTNGKVVWNWFFLGYFEPVDSLVIYDDGDAAMAI